MAEPSFNGVNIFGPCPESNRVEPPNARQLNGFPPALKEEPGGDATLVKADKEKAK